MLNTYRIPEYKFDTLKRKLNALVRRAGKLGVAPIEWSDNGTAYDALCRRCYRRDALGPFCSCAGCDCGDKRKESRVEVHIVTIGGESPTLNGWSLVAVLEPYGEGVMVKSVPGVECPSSYRKADPSDCEHCNTRRRRNQTFVVSHENGEHKQVGRQCIKDFLGHKAPDSIGSFYASIFRLLDELGDADREEWGGGGEWPIDVGIAEFLSMSAACIARDGWMSRAAARDGLGSSTADAAWYFLTARKLSERELKVRREYTEVAATKAELAAKAIAWATALDARSDYEHNVKLVVEAGFVSGRAAGIAASIVPAYMRAHEQEVMMRKRAAESAHVGTVGEREVFELMLVSVRGVESYSQFSDVVFLHKFVDRDGNDLVWWTSSAKWGTEGADWSEDEYRKIRATVKEHARFKGVAQTNITRLFEVKAKAKRKRKAKPKKSKLPEPEKQGEGSVPFGDD